MEALNLRKAGFKGREVIGTEDRTALLGSGAADQAPNATYSDKEIGKIVKLSADSRYQLAAVGDEIEAFVLSTEPATIDGFCLGTIVDKRGITYKKVTLDGLQATPGTGTVAVGDYVVTGTPVAKGTALGEPPRVCKRTDPTTVAGALASTFRWRVVAIFGTSGTVGTPALIEPVL